MARRKYMNGLKRHPSHYRNKSPMLHDSKTSHPHPHSEKLETTLLDSVYTSERSNPTIIKAGYDPHSKVTISKDGKVTKGSSAGGYVTHGSRSEVTKIPDYFQQMGKETKDNTFSRNMLAPEDYF